MPSADFGGHFNPAVTVGLTVAGKFGARRDDPLYHRATGRRRAGGAAFYVIASGKAGVDLGGFAANGYGEHRRAVISMMSASCWKPS